MRADLIARGQQLDELVDRAATAVPNPQVAKAMDMIDHAYADAMRGTQVLGDELIMLRAEVAAHGGGDERLAVLLRVADELVTLAPQPSEAIADLLAAARHYAGWLAARRGEDEVKP